MQPQITQFGKYELLEVLGEGGMARVYRAVRSGPMGFRKEVALKQILPHVAKEEKLVRALINEARLGGHLRHRNIVEVYEFDQVDDVFYIAMEYVAGHTLDRLLARMPHQGPLPPRIVADIGMQLCAGLQYAHTARDDQGNPMQLVHRDLKPTNVMLQTDGTVKIMDFGIARAETNLFRTTTASVTKGTPVYMSPEQVRGNPLDHRSDLFTLGSVLAEMVTGQVAFQGTQLYQVLQKVARAETGEVLAAVHQRMPLMVPILQRCYQPDPQARYQWAGEIRADMEAMLPRLAGDERLEQWLGVWVSVPLPPRAAPAADLAAHVPPSQPQGTPPPSWPGHPPATTMSQGSIAAGVPADSTGAPMVPPHPTAWPSQQAVDSGATAHSAGYAAPSGVVTGGQVWSAPPGTNATTGHQGYPQPSFPPPSTPPQGTYQPSYPAPGQPPTGGMTGQPPAGSAPYPTPGVWPTPTTMTTGETPQHRSSALPWIMVGVLLTVVLIGGGAAVVLGLGGLVVLGGGERTVDGGSVAAVTGDDNATAVVSDDGVTATTTAVHGSPRTVNTDSSNTEPQRVDGQDARGDDGGSTKGSASDTVSAGDRGAVNRDTAAASDDVKGPLQAVDTTGDARDAGDTRDSGASGDTRDAVGETSAVVPIHQRDPEDVLPAPGSPAGTNAETADTLPRSMVTALESVDADERESAAEDLEDHQGADASAAIERLVKTDPSENVRYEAIRAGKKRKTAADVRIAIWALRNDGSSKVRVQACKTLEEIGDTAALRPLCRALLHDSDPAVRKAAAETIGNFEDRSALEALIYQESHESDERVLDEIRSAIDDLE